MKKLLKSEIYWPVNSIQDPYVAENWLKSQTFRLKKKKGRNQTCVWEAQNALPKRTLRVSLVKLFEIDFFEKVGFLKSTL